MRMSRRTWIIVGVSAVVISIGIGILIFSLVQNSGSTAMKAETPFYMIEIKPNVFFDDDGNSLDFVRHPQAGALRYSYAIFSEDFSMFTVNFMLSNPRRYNFIVITHTSNRNNFTATLSSIVGGRLLRFNLEATANSILITSATDTKVIINDREEPETLYRDSPVLRFQAERPPFLTPLNGGGP